MQALRSSSSLSTASGGIASGVIKLARLIGRIKPDIVQGWMYHGDLAALVALVLSGGAGGPASFGAFAARTWICAATVLDCASW